MNTIKNKIQTAKRQLMFVGATMLIIAAICSFPSLVQKAKASGLLSTQAIQGGVGAGQGGNIPLAITNATSTNFDAFFDVSAYRDVTLQFTGNNHVNSSNTYTIQVNGQNILASGATNEFPLFTWSVSMTNTTRYTTLTNLTSGNGFLAGVQYIKIFGITNAAINAGTGNLTNWFISLAGK